MSLANWARNDWLVAHETSEREIADLLSVIDRDLEDSAAAELSPDWRLNIAYNAALQAAQAALAAAGYRISRGGAAHHRSIESLRLTLGLGAKTVARLDAFRKRRNIAEYDRAGVTSADEADEMRQLALALRDTLLDWLRSEHPGLLP